MRFSSAIHGLRNFCEGVLKSLTVHLHMPFSFDFICAVEFRDEQWGAIDTGWLFKTVEGHGRPETSLQGRTRRRVLKSHPVSVVTCAPKMVTSRAKTIIDNHLECNE